MPSDCNGDVEDPFVCLNKIIENKSWILGGKNQRVPAQRLKDFMEDKLSLIFLILVSTGLTSVRMDEFFLNL